MSKLFPLLTIILIAASSTNAQSEKKQFFSVGDFAPDFTTKTIDGKPFKLSDHRGKYVLLNFWGTWCQPCRYEIPEIKDMQLFYANDSFEIVSISVEHIPMDIHHFVDSAGMNWTQISELSSNDPHKSISGLYQLGMFPSNFLIDKEGKIIQYPVGFVRTEDGIMKEVFFAGSNLIPRTGEILGKEKNMNRYLSLDAGNLFSIDAPNAKAVYLAGSFFGWGHFAMYKYQDKWVRRLYLTPGTYQYKFIVDDKWIVDPTNKNVVDDGTGNKNSMVIIKQ